MLSEECVISEGQIFVDQELDRVIMERPEVVDQCNDAIGSDDHLGPALSILDELRISLRTTLGSSPTQLTRTPLVTSKLDPQLLEDWRHVANDPGRPRA